MERQKYSQEFKEQAVRLSEVSDKSVAQVARELGIHTKMLYRWRREAGETKRLANAHFPGMAAAAMKSWLSCASNCGKPNWNVTF